MVIKMLIKYEESQMNTVKNFSKRDENIRKYQTEVITEMKLHWRGSIADWMM